MGRRYAELALSAGVLGLGVFTAVVTARLPGEGARFSPNSPEQFAAFVKSEIAKWAPVVKASGARVD